MNQSCMQIQSLECVIYHAWRIIYNQAGPVGSKYHIGNMLVFTNKRDVLYIMIGQIHVKL